MMPAPTPDTSLADLTRRLGHPKAQVRGAAAQTLHESGDQGLDALLSAWQQEEKQETRRGVVGVTGLAVGLLAGLTGFFFPLNDTVAMLCFCALFAGFAGAILCTTPSRLQRGIAGALSEYDDPRTLRPLAQSLRMLTSDDPRRAQVIARLRQGLQQQPGHEIYFPETKKTLRWQPELTHRSIRFFWLWLALTLFMVPISAMVYAFFFTGWSHTGAGVTTGFTMPIVYTFMAWLMKDALRTDVTYTRRVDPAVRPWRLLVGTGVVIALVGVVTHAIRGHHPSWSQIAWASVGIPVCWWLANLAGRRALPEPPETQT